MAAKAVPKTTVCDTGKNGQIIRIEILDIAIVIHCIYDTHIRYVFLGNNMSRTFAYCRVSTSLQTTENQIKEIAAAGFTVESHRIHAESISGKIPASERPGFVQLLNKLESGDVLIVTKLDRLGRSTADVLSTVAKLEHSGVKVHCLALGGMDLTSPAGKMTMSVLAAVAEFERDLLIERTQSGLQRAKDEGKRLGRKQTYTPEQAKEVKAAVSAGMSIRKAAAQFQLSAGTVQRIVA